MPFMRGSMPVRRTIAYLEQAPIHLRDNVRIFTMNCHYDEPTSSSGTQKFIYWHWAQLQHKNPEVQMVKYQGITPNPWVQAFLDDGQEIVLDLDGLSQSQVVERINKVLGKTELSRQREDYENSLSYSPAYFGFAQRRQCACEVQGQQPCPITIPVPTHLTGRWRWAKPET